MPPPPPPQNGKTGSGRSTPATGPAKAAKGPQSSADLPPAKKKSARRLELIDYPEDAPLVDHKGRTKPMYKARSPRPPTPRWRPSKPARVLLGIFPGARLMAVESARDGLWFSIFGLITLVLGVFLTARFYIMVERLQSLAIKPLWIVVYAGAIWLAVSNYELLRLGATWAERRKGPRTPRLAAAFMLPSLVILSGVPLIVEVWPRFLESAWLASIVVFVGSVPAAAWCTLDTALKDDDQQRWFRRLTAVYLFVTLILLIALAVQGYEPLALATERAGFQFLPALLRS